MKEMLAKILKVFFIIAGVLLLLLLVYGIILVLDWPWWMGIFVLLAMGGIFLGAVFLKKVWLDRREQSFVNQIVGQEELAASDETADASADLAQRFKESANELKSSHLKNVGNPLYVLPWYMVIGESGSGKTTAIKNADMSSPFAQANRISGISGTKNCDWWFFEQAVILDTAGRYAVHVDQERDKQEWQDFLVHLAKYRKREPINGLVVTLSTDKLLDSRPEALEDAGITIRRRVDELMQVLGAKFPVYLLVSKCDLIKGMTQFCEALPEESLKQAMGLVNSDLSSDTTSFAKQVMESVTERLRNLRLLLSHKPNLSDAPTGAQAGVDPSILLFPEEFEKIKPGLEAFIKGAFKENPYQESPLLRGIYFSSGRQEGTPFSHFLSALNLIGEREVLPGTNKGLFLHDFFAKILPKDRKLFIPTQKALEVDKLTKNLGLASWVAVAIAVCGLLSLSFVKNLRTLREVSQEFSQPAILAGDIVEDVVTMDRFKQAVLKVEKQNMSWWIPRLGLYESNKIEAQLKNKYCKQFKQGFLVSFDQQMADNMTGFSAMTPAETTGQYVPHIVRRINLLKSRIESGKLEDLAAMPLPSYKLVESMSGRTVIPEIREKLGELYLYYLMWEDSSEGFNKEMTDLHTWLKHLLTKKYANLNWIVKWVNQNPDLSGFILEDFWGGSLDVEDETAVLPAFTIKGKEQIDSFQKEMEDALFDRVIIAGKKKEFKKLYEKSYMEAWYDFGVGFPKGIERLKNKDEWNQVAGAVTRGQGPYFSLLDKMVIQLEPMAENDDLPAWFNLTNELNETRLKARSMDALSGKSSLLKVTSKGNKLLRRLESKKRGVSSAQGTEGKLVSASAFMKYKNALKETAPITLSMPRAFEMTVKAFKEDPFTSDSPFLIAQFAVSTLKNSMTPAGAEQKMLWNLVKGPINFQWAYACMQTGCNLQQIWEDKVLVEVLGISDQEELINALMGADGFAKKYVDGEAEPFISRSPRRGYYSKKIEGLDRNVEFSDEFFVFITKGAKAAKPVKDSYRVTIKGEPTDVNREARVRPHATILSLQCGEGEKQTMMNLQYPVRKTFTWSPEDCSDVIFKIEVGNLVLTKEYTGYRAFPKFLKGYQKGYRVFFRKDFKESEAALKRLGIKYIKVKYKLSGHKPVIRLIPDMPGNVPEDIVKCWE